MNPKAKQNDSSILMWTWSTQREGRGRQLGSEKITCGLMRGSKFGHFLLFQSHRVRLHGLSECLFGLTSLNPSRTKLMSLFVWAVFSRAVGLNWSCFKLKLTGLRPFCFCFCFVLFFCLFSVKPVDQKIPNKSTVPSAQYLLVLACMVLISLNQFTDSFN